MVRTHQTPEPKDSSLGDELINGLFQFGWLGLRSSLVILWWAALFPTLSLPVGIAAYAFFAEGWGWGWSIVIAAADLVFHAGWRLLWPRSFKTFITGRIWKRWRRWNVYRKPWASLCALHGLTATLNDSVLIPPIKKLEVGYIRDALKIKLLTGQTVIDWSAKSDALAHALGARFVQATSAEPGFVNLIVQHSDSLSTPLPVPATSQQVDFENLNIGATDAHAPWNIRLLGRHILVAGATGAGKGSVVWSILAALAPAIKTGEASLWVIDPKGGMEFGRGSKLFNRFSYDTDENTLLLLRDAARILAERANRLRGIARQHQPSSEEPLIVLAIDELAALTAYITDRKVKTEVEQLVSLILSQGRAVGVSVVACVQDPSKEVLAFRQLFPTRIALRLAEASQVPMVLGLGAHERGAHCESISDQMPGTGYVCEDGKAEPTRIRAFHVTDRDIDQLTVNYQPSERSDQPEGKTFTAD